MNRSYIMPRSIFLLTLMNIRANTMHLGTKWIRFMEIIRTIYVPRERKRRAIRRSLINKKSGGVNHLTFLFFYGIIDIEKYK